MFPCAFERTVNYFVFARLVNLFSTFQKDLSVFLCYSVFKELLPGRTVLPVTSLFEEFTDPSKLNRKFTQLTSYIFLLRKEVIHPHVLVGIPCYDLTPITSPAFDGSFLAVRPPASGITGSHGMTGGVYKARERIHRGMLIRDY